MDELSVRYFWTPEAMPHGDCSHSGLLSLQWSNTDRCPISYLITASTEMDEPQILVYTGGSTFILLCFNQPVRYNLQSGC